MQTMNGLKAGSDTSAQFLSRAEGITHLTLRSSLVAGEEGVGGFRSHNFPVDRSLDRSSDRFCSPFCSPDDGGGMARRGCSKQELWRDAQ